MKEAVETAWAFVDGLEKQPYSTSVRKRRDRPINHVVASDASSSGGGYITYQWSEGLKREHQPGEFSFKWPQVDVKAEDHIYFKGMRACVMAMSRFSKLHPSEKAYLVVDNSEVAFGLRNGFTNSTKGMKMIIPSRRAVARLTGQVQRLNPTLQ